MTARTPFRALLLAAGRGSRMAGLTEQRPKCLLEVEGRPLLDWQVDALRAAGAGEIGIVTGYRRELLAGRGLVEFHNPRWAETQMVASLACASSWLEEGPVLVSYSDILFDGPAIVPLAETPAALAIAFDPAWHELWTRRFGDPLVDAETFRIDADGSLREIGGRPKTLAEIEGQYMGLLWFTPAGWAAAEAVWAALPPEERDRVHMTGLLQRAITAGRMPVQAVAYHGRWGEFDSPEDLRTLTERRGE